MGEQLGRFTLREIRSIVLSMLEGLDAAIKDSEAQYAEIKRLTEIETAARACVDNPAWAGMCDEDVALENALNPFSVHDLNKDDNDGSDAS